MRRSALRRTADAGFTLIELLIVIVILGILAAIVVFSVTGITDRGNTAACKATVAEVDVAAEAYVAQNGGTASGLTMTQIKTFFHNSTPPTKAGNHTIAATDTVATVDGFTASSDCQ
jgi:general secretion pathway protein G